MKQEIKDIMEVLALLEKMIEQYAKAKEDGELSLSDIKYLFDLFAPLADALKGITNVVSEFKDLDVEEAKELGARAFDMVKKIIALF